MNKYRRIVVDREKKEVPENEIRVTARGRTTTYVSYASKIFNGKNLSDLKIVATGTALSTAVTITEILKRRFKGLHQITKVGSIEITDEYEPLEEGLDKVTDVRSVSFIEVLLSKNELDKTDKGYQQPIPEDQVHEVSAEELIRGGRKGGRKGGRSPRSSGASGEKGKAKGKGKDDRGRSKGGKKGGKRDESQSASPARKGKGKGGKTSSKGKGSGKGKSSSYNNDWDQGWQSQSQQGFWNYWGEWESYAPPKGKGKGGKAKGKSGGKGKGKGKGKK